jgi:hypothetical protein
LLRENHKSPTPPLPSLLFLLFLQSQVSHQKRTRTLQETKPGETTWQERNTQNLSVLDPTRTHGWEQLPKRIRDKEHKNEKLLKIIFLCSSQLIANFIQIV